jgi:hypothetical protein
VLNGSIYSSESPSAGVASTGAGRGLRQALVARTVVAAWARAAGALVILRACWRRMVTSEAMGSSSVQGCRWDCSWEARLCPHNPTSVKWVFCGRPLDLRGCPYPTFTHIFPQIRRYN